MAVTGLNFCLLLEFGSTGISGETGFVRPDSKGLGVNSVFSGNGPKGAF